ncbi:head GIN domain-containing protein [Marinifilum sp. RC60d5]|uniref:head GIN domain-containing protein n=1 Tax=Marinifilum sp. RC60d5 TaxID=3458414 RepID=UPI004036D94B
MNSKYFNSLAFVFVFFFSISMLMAQTTENRKTESFKSINLSISAKVYLTQENTTSVKIKAYDRDLNEIITEVEGSTLKIKRKSNKSWGWNTRSLKKVEVYISTPNIENLKISGSGNIIAQTPINSGSVAYTISGSGNIIIDKLNAENVNCSISGSGDVRLKGECEDEVNIRISGSGDVEASHFIAKKADIRISGSGDCEVYASDKITARVAGSGDIYYRGKPEYVDSKSAGSGSIKSVGE